MKSTRKISEGLNLMYVGNIIIIVAALCTLLAMLMPFLVILTSLAVIVGGVVCLVGLVKLRNEHSDYFSALMACVFGIVFGLLSNNESVLGGLMDLAKAICSLLQVYFVIRGTNSFLLDRGSLEQVEIGRKAWKWQIITIILNALTLILTLTIVLAPLGVVLGLADIVVGIIALVYYLSYVKDSAAVLS